MKALILYDPNQQTTPLGATEIRVALKGILMNASFSHSPMLTAFLSYVVETTLKGHGDRLKAYSIALDGLGRGADFNSETDAIVRVHANRTRHALKRYYASAGADDAVIIDLPRGRYVPTFSRRALCSGSAQPVLPRSLVANTTRLTLSRYQTVNAWIAKRLRRLAATE